MKEPTFPYTWWRQVGALLLPKAHPAVPVPGTSRSIPLYLLAPEAKRGLKARRRAARWWLATAVLGLVSVLDRVHYASRWHPLWLSLTFLIGLLASASALIADSIKPTPRPYSDDIDRW